MDSSLSYPLRHVSIRVPWHDSGWAGTVCSAPNLNGACAKLKRIAGHKKDDIEVPLKGRRLDELPREQWPCCIAERATFMAPFEMDQIKEHALVKKDPTNYGHFLPTEQRYPAYSAGLVPFAWMMHENMQKYRDLFELDVDDEREPDLGYRTNWIHEAQNQAALLDAFAAHLRKEHSLTFFYAKHVPFVEGTSRVLIGVGKVREIGLIKEFGRSRDGLRGMIWERPIQHSIRPKGKDGFLIPYYDLLELAEKDPTIDTESYTARAPEEHWSEFSFGSELVTHDGAIAALLSLDTALSNIESDLGIITEWQRKWIHDELVRLWKVRGPFPGLGAVLSAFGLSRGLFVAHALQEKAGENKDPWPAVDKSFNDPASVLPKELHRDLKELAPTWKRLPRERKTYLQLLSRFELSVDHAKALYDEASRRKRLWTATDKEVISNPYRIYEISRHDMEGVGLLTIDRGVFPEDSVRLLHPLDAPSRLDSAVDLRRIRAFTIDALEEAASGGHTLLPKDKVVERILTYPVQPDCPVTSDTLVAQALQMGPDVVPVGIQDDLGLQLDRYQSIGEQIRKQVKGRVAGARHKVGSNWSKLLEKKFGRATDDEEWRAQEEKSAALTELGEARLSVLAGPAGAGKTTVLGILCSQREIFEDGLLLLAPTGKARVRMQQLASGSATQAFTVAQFLKGCNRYDGRCARYHLSNHPKATGFGTVIVDESSMLTEDMLGALFDALQGVKRFVFVGDPAQLPPIGAGRPFVDIIAQLRPANFENLFPRVAPGYAELTIERRQIGNDRPDLSLARWFSTAIPSPGEDEIFSAGENEHERIRFVEWQTSDEFQSKLLKVLVEELKLNGLDDVRGFNRALGAAPSGDYDYFNRSRNGQAGSVDCIENWQVLSPLRGMPFGVGDINRQIHERFRSTFIELASRDPRFRKIPPPMGAERIVYGDKVINLNNHLRDGNKVYPSDGALGYLANGEIGIACGQWKTKNSGAPKILKIEFSSQPGYAYDFYRSNFREEGDPALELAYALTVHKAQGSQFKVVILVLPEDHPTMSRELVYTALTRHQDKVVVMHQGSRTRLKEFASLTRSETAKRMTNLLQDCLMKEFPLTKGSVFLQEGLIHRTENGRAVRSKSELIIADALTNAKVQWEYEVPLTLGGKTRFPDFTIEDDISGRTYYWEHLGLLHREDYLRAWKNKLAWYRTHGVLPNDEGIGPKGTLLHTRDSKDGGIDSGALKKMIKKVFNL